MQSFRHRHGSDIAGVGVGDVGRKIVGIGWRSGPVSYNDNKAHLGTISHLYRPLVHYCCPYLHVERKRVPDADSDYCVDLEETFEL